MICPECGEEVTSIKCIPVGGYTFPSGIELSLGVDVPAWPAEDTPGPVNPSRMPPRTDSQLKFERSGEG